MSGTKSGGEKASITNKQRYGEDWYSKIGKRGVLHRRQEKETRPFYKDRKLASRAGAIGGRISRRRSKPMEVTEKSWIKRMFG